MLNSPPRRHVLPRALGPVPDGDLAAPFESLGNPTRLRIVERLAATPEVRVSDLAFQLGVSQPRLSWHLRLLRRSRIVTTRRDGREVLCRLDREAILDHLGRFRALIDGRLSIEPTPSAAAALGVPTRESPLPEVLP